MRKDTYTTPKHDKQTTAPESTRVTSPGSGFRAIGAAIVKAAFVALLAVFLVAVYRYVDAKDVSLDVMREWLTAETDLSSMEACDERQLRQFIGVEPSEYVDFIYYKGSEALSVDELLIIKVEDKSTLDGIMDRVERRVNTQIGDFESYGPELVRRLEDAVLIRRGIFLFFCVADDQSIYEEVFRDFV